MFLRILRLFLTALAVSVLAVGFSPPAPLAAADCSWSPVPLPAEGVSGGWVLATGSDVRFLAAAADGTLYCYATPAGTAERLFKSTNAGVTWASVGRVRDSIVAIACAQFDTSTVYYATSSRVYRSTDAGTSFIGLPPNPGGAGTGNIQITSLDVIRRGNGNLVAVATRDTDAGQFGGVYVLDEGSASGVWLDTAVGALDVLAVAFSPAYIEDQTIFAAATDETDTLVRAMMADFGWGRITTDAALAGVSPIGVSMAFPHGYGPQGDFYLGINSGSAQGDVCLVSQRMVPAASSITRLGVGLPEGLPGIDISSLVCAGEGASASIVAGCAGQARTYTSADGGRQWTRCQKPPSGQTDVSLATGRNAGGAGLYAATSGSESAFSVSADGGISWDQTSLIDTQVSNLADFDVMPGMEAPTLFLVTHNAASGTRSLWKTGDGGAHWQRSLSSGVGGIDTIELVAASPDGAIFVAGKAAGKNVLCLSSDGGRTFVLRASPGDVAAWAFVDNSNFFIADVESGVSLVYCTTNGGLFYSPPTEVGLSKIISMVVSPAHAQDKTIALGDRAGHAYISKDSGATFTQLGQQLPVSAGLGGVQVVFDPAYATNSVIYAVVDTKTTATSKDRVFRFVVDKSTAWQSIAGALPVDALIKQAAITGDGVLYVVDGQAAVAASAKGGALRSVGRTMPQPAWETASDGVADGVKLTGLWSLGNQLWVMDTANVLLTMSDPLGAQVALTSPEDGASAAGTDTEISWQSVAAATEYEWQVCDDSGFSSVASGMTGSAASTSSRPAGLEPGITYSWRVRVTHPFLGPWSAVWSFATLVGGAGVTPLLTSPPPGSQTTGTPVFVWSPVVGADRYELLVATETSFAEPVVRCTGEESLATNAWSCRTALEPGSTYFWKVRARTADNYGDWSPVSYFTTAPPPPLQEVDGTLETATSQPAAQPLITVVTTAPQPLPPSVPVTVEFNMPVWAIISGLALLAIIAIMLAVFLVVYAKKRS